MMQKCFLFLLGLLIACPTLVFAQSEAKQIKLHAAAEPDPALRYLFWPAPENRIQGNASTFLSRAVLLHLQASASEDEVTAGDARYIDWLEQPLDELPLKDVKEFLERRAGPALRELDRAETLMQSDYDLRFADLSMAEMVSTVLPELQEYRSLARMLSLRARVAIIEERWDDFARDVRVGLRLSELASNGNDLLISRLVGIAINAVTLSSVEEAMQRAGCPNFYWALAATPDRLFGMREAIEYESILLAKLTTHIGPLPDSVLGPARSRELLRRFGDEASLLFGAAGLASSDEAMRDLLVGAAVVSLTDISREMLESDSNWSGRVDELSSAEAVLRATVLHLERSRHNWLKWAMMPDYLFADYGPRIEQDLANSKDDPNLFLLLANQLVPSVVAAERAGRRGEQSRNLLITYEALRMHASQTGELPETLDHLEPVPAWHDPFTNKSFEYHRNSASQATLARSPRYPGDDERKYEISLVPESNPSKSEPSQ